MKKYDLNRFKTAQEQDYANALSEIRSGKKRNHWIWYIFPQLKGLGLSGMSEYYGLDGIGEAKAYMEDPILRERLLEITTALNELSENDPGVVMGYPDNLKLRSCMTLFSVAAPEVDLFRNVLEKFFDGISDEVTLRLLEKEKQE